VVSLNPATLEGDAIVGLFTIALIASIGVLALVYCVLGTILVRFRRRPGEALQEPARSTGNRRLEVAWTLGPLLLVAILFIPTIGTMRGVAAQDQPDALQVDVVGHQWWWEYRYPAMSPDASASPVVTANELHLPVSQPVRLRLDSADVQHEFWVPQFGWKSAIYPGKVNGLNVTLREAGTLDGACTEYCGTEHAWMHIRVLSQSPDQFGAWLENEALPARQPADPDSIRGQEVFVTTVCVSCHTIRGTTATGQIGPDLTHIGSRSILGAGIVDNTPENLYRWIRNPHDLKPGVLMPASNGLADSDLRALAAYLLSLR
jgi:cytochrome c oxidase subunit 2